jgi:heat shock protein HslJ
MNKCYLLWVLTCLFLSACSVGGNRTTTDLLSPQDIIGSWHIKLINNQPTLEHSQTELTLAADNRLSGKASCNRISASYLLTPEQAKTMLTFSLTAVTRMMCPHVLMVQEQQFLDAMTKVAQVKLVQGSLILLSEDGMLLFKANKVKTSD